MKKYILVILSAIFLYNFAHATDFSADITFDKGKINEMYQQDINKLTGFLRRAVAPKKTFFINDRVKNMCLEWPTCAEWANNKFLKDSSFQVIDAEVERWLSKWEDGQAIWEYKFYIQTKENGQTKNYLFKRDIKGQTYYAPVLIKKFPGHPIASKPSERISNPKASVYSWPNCKKWEHFDYIASDTTSQYIYKYDEQGNALWKMRLYVRVLRFFYHKAFYFEAYQTKAGGDYIYKGPVEMKVYPTPKFDYK